MGVQSTRTSKSSSWLIFLFSLYFVVLNQCCTQYLAHIFHYSSFLGSHFFGFYLPFSWFFWIFKFYDYAPHQCNLTFVLSCIGTLIGLASFSIWAGFWSRNNKSTDDLHGTAHFATFDEVQETGLLPRKKQKGQDVYCGAFKDHKTGVLHYLRHDGPEHIIVLTPTRSGKGVGLVVPTLLSWPHSLFVLDTKGENYAMTAGWRKQYAGNKILRFDPAEPDIGCSWNSLGEIRFRTRHQVADTQNIALMVIDDGRSKTIHRHRLLLMLDEFPILGKLAYIAGYGLKAYITTQDVQQLYKIYTTNESIISNCHIRIAYAPNKVETAEWMSKMAGETTIVREKISTSGKRFGMMLEQVSTSYEETKRPLMTTDEIMRLQGAKKDHSGNIIEPGEMLICRWEQRD